MSRTYTVTLEGARRLPVDNPGIKRHRVKHTVEVVAEDVERALELAISESMREAFATIHTASVQ